MVGCIKMMEPIYLKFTLVEKILGQLCFFLLPWTFAGLAIV
jgi:hypothetical protein